MRTAKELTKQERLSNLKHNLVTLVRFASEMQPGPERSKVERHARELKTKIEALENRPY